ncbi:esterase/lipase family protein [Streptomyces sp. NBC_01716]|uniref:esterase/lipase family protein n=1 Tax=Streptomyces sp. NBC_01716 TaxID=2975917 RepID=UPI002E37710C|nr:alpha/beta hydrolase [Streptomyces sp. NBC_01716]
MQKPQRRLRLLLSAALAVVLTMLTVTPASAAPGRANGKNNRVIFVHGFAPTGKHDCTDYFSAARGHFAKKGWRGNLLTFGYYSGNKKCSYNYRGSRDTSLKTVAKAFANYVYKNYSNPKKNVKVDVVAHSMGGLVVRAALHHTAKGTAGFPPRLYIEDVVTLGTPHGGTNWGNVCAAGWQQCADMKPNSAFLKSLPNAMPNSRMGTDWTTVSSFDDAIVSEASGIAGIAEHEVQYDAGIGHNELNTVRSGTHRSRIKHSTWGKWFKRMAPVEQARLAVYFSSAT